MLHKLPVEIALQTISNLPLHSLCTVSLVSRDWNALITTNEPAVYRNAAILHLFIDGNQFDADPTPVDWKTNCRRELEIERGWRGKQPTVVQELTATGTMVHRVKVDRDLGFVIVTFHSGGLSVCDIKSNRILWALPSSHVTPYAHLEYERGFVVFNRLDNCKEVWRRTFDSDADQYPETSPPDKKMLDASAQAARTYSPAANHHGHFRAWALICIPESSRAFRLSYPTLLVAAKNNAYLWDVSKPQLVSVVRDIQRSHHDFKLAAINYVEVNDLYVFICGSGGLRIFARDDGTLLYQLSTKELASLTWDVLPQTRGLVSSVIHPQMLLHNHHCSILHGEFMACHVSASGDSLAALTTNGRLVIFPGFQRLFAESNTVHHRDIAIILNFRSRPFAPDEDISCYLAVGSRNGKLAVATRNGIYVVSPDVDFSRLTASKPPEPGVSVCRLSRFEDPRLLDGITCLQITHDAIYFTYKPSQTGGAPPNADHVPVQNVGAHGAPDVEAENDDLADVVEEEDEDEDGWVDDGFLGGEVELGGGENANPMDVFINNWFLATALNTVWAVTFA